MGDYGIKITQPGANILSVDKRDYIFNSSYFYMSTFIVTTISYTFPSDLSTVDIVTSFSTGNPLVSWFSFDGTSVNSQWKGSDLWTFYYSSGGNTAQRFWDVLTDTNKTTIHYGENLVGGSGFNTTGESWQFKLYVFINPST